MALKTNIQPIDSPPKVEHGNPNYPVTMIALNREEKLELENLQLKIQLTRFSITQLEAQFKSTMQQVFVDHEVSNTEFVLDMNQGVLKKR